MQFAAKRYFDYWKNCSILMSFGEFWLTVQRRAWIIIANTNMLFFIAPFTNITRATKFRNMSWFQTNIA